MLMWSEHYLFKDNISLLLPGTHTFHSKLHPLYMEVTLMFLVGYNYFLTLPSLASGVIFKKLP